MVASNDTMRQCPIENMSLSYHERGSGPPVLLVHGFPFTSQIWNRTGDLLVSRGLWEIAPDLRGFGQSPLPDDRTITTVKQFADDLCLLLEKMGVTEKVFIVGLSMGGYVAIQFAQKYAERLSGIVLCGTKTAADAPPIAETRRKQAAALLEGSLSMADIADMMIPKLFSTATQMRKPELIAELRNIIESQQHIQGIAAAMLGMAERPDTTEVLQQLEIPVLAVCGAEDQFSPPVEMRRLAETAKQGTYIEIPDAGHLLPMEQPELFADVFDKLRR